MITYLQDDKKLCVTAYNTEKLFSVEIFRCEDLYIKEYDDLEDLSDSIRRDLSYGFTFSDKKIFDKKFKEFKDRFNSLTKEL